MRSLAAFIVGSISLAGASVFVGMDGARMVEQVHAPTAEPSCDVVLPSPRVFAETPVAVDELGCLATLGVFKEAVEAAPTDIPEQFSAAIDSLNRQSSVFRTPALRQRALWSIGWVAFRKGDYVSARGVFQYLEREAPYGRQAPAAIYWAARAAGELGDQVSYRSELAALAERFPVDYYATQAIARLEEIEDEGFEVTTARLSEASRGAKAVLARALVDVGARGQASQVLRRALLEDREGMGPQEYEALGAVALDLGSRYFETRFRWERTKRFPTANSTTVRSLGLMFPWDYVRVVHRAARSNRVEASLAIGLARQESAFNPRAVSHAGASGLMQLMPQTAAELAGRSFEDETENDIFNPELNAQLGATYVRQLMALHDGRVERALASYNAGPSAVARWGRRLGETPDDVFVEEIPYRETRDYVRAVLSWKLKYEFLQAARVKLLDEEKRAAVTGLLQVRKG